MPSFAHLARTLAILGFITGYAAFAAQAQTEEVVSLKQITIQIPANESKAEQKVRIDAFRTATRAINSCADVDAVARKLGGAVVFQQQMRMFNLPPPVRLLLASAGPDRATVPFGKAPEVRVLVQCGASRNVPSRARPTA